MRASLFGVVALGLLTAACGTTEQQRSATGGLTGLGVGALVGGPVGAIVGAAVGAAGGAVIPEGADTVAFNAIGQGKRAANSALADAGLAQGSSGTSTAAAKPAPAAAPEMRGESAQAVRQAQAKLQRDGLYTGRIDGIAGPKTSEALSIYQEQQGLQRTAKLDSDTMQRLGLAGAQTAQGAANTTQGSGASTPQPSMTASDVRQRLQADGYSNISDVRRQSDTTYTARADRGDQSYRLRVDARSGRVLWHQTLAAGQQQPNAASGSSAGASGTTSGTNAGNTPAAPENNPAPENGGAGTSTSTSTGNGAGTPPAPANDSGTGH